jgi:hypothetical protein
MRITHPKRTAAAVLALALATSVGFAVAAQGAPVDHDVRQSDFIPALSDTRATGHYDFLKEGVRLYTEGATSTDKAAEYFDIGTSMPASGAYDWYGTTDQPGAQIVFDADQDTTNTNNYNVLVGEQVYSANAPGGELTDWWLTGPGGDGQVRAAANGYTCPQTSGGSGSNCHGTLAEWKAAVPNAKVLAGGFSLGSGVQGDGVLRSLSFGEDRYVFTDLAPVTEPTPDPVVNPAGTVVRSVYKRTILFQLKTAAIPEGSQAGTLPVFKVTSTDSTTTGQTPAPGTTGYYTNTCPLRTTCTYKAYKNNVLVSQYTIKK